MDYVGSLVTANIGPPPDAAEGGTAGQKRVFAGGGATAFQPPAKRPITGSSVYERTGGGDEKQEFVDKIKALQRTDSAAKEAWWQFCDETAEG
eukprot:CAMPEP_0179355204 /NCGR_PEP_ID=MMETSP0797-20121207/77255_1 /TAXON_ID=47934 /ORGANISM="Dinophysis acuminata, Strain DAEP01" /LENGTH=92 /DNA_ID=CAMNT_0021070349 /DNA_START=1 /DNA_END=275 /DNA_ORIENTATION=-